MLPVPTLPNAAFATAGHGGDRESPTGKDFENAVLIARQRLGKSASPSGKVYEQCMWSGRTTQASMVEGRAHLPNRLAQRVDLRHQQARSASRFTVKKNAAPGTRLRR
jgi:hypothetical protein